MNLAVLSRLLPGVVPPRSHYYRMVDARYADQIDETAQTVLHSWRYNPSGEFGVLYLSISPDCRRREKLRQAQGNIEFLPPQVLGEFKVQLSRCLDLTDAAVLNKLDVSRQDLIRPEDFSAPQAIARAARRIGFEAIIAPSAIGDDCHSLVLFKDRLSPPASCEKIRVRPAS